MILLIRNRFKTFSYYQSIFNGNELEKFMTATLTEVLRQGVDLLAEVDNGLCTAREKNSSMSDGEIGGHFRHCIEFVNCFLSGVESGRVDYENRERNQRIENELKFAIAEILQTIAALENLQLAENGNKLLVKPEDFVGNTDFWCESSIERELEFLQSSLRADCVEVAGVGH